MQDPTGCGDAYRAGLLYGLLHKLDWETTGRIASLMGSIKIEHQGPQNQRFTYDEFADQFRQQPLSEHDRQIGGSFENRLLTPSVNCVPLNHGAFQPSCRSL